MFHLIYRKFLLQFFGDQPKFIYFINFIIEKLERSTIISGPEINI